MRIDLARLTATAIIVLITAYPVPADSPFATTVVDFSPAPGQFANVPEYNNPARAIGAPIGGGHFNPDNNKLVSLGGFGGSLTLKFDHTVMDDVTNPRCLDAIVFGNPTWIGGNANRHWAECGVIEISKDINENGLADDPWYLIPGSHITDPVSQWQTQTWDDDIEDETYPPLPVSESFPYQDWIPPGQSGVWDTSGWRLPSSVFDVAILENPNGLGATDEGIFGYADLTPVLILGDLDADNIVDEPAMPPEEFYTFPDDPLTVGISSNAGGGDAFDIAWAIEPATGEPANLDGFDFIRITNGNNWVSPFFGELSTEIGAVADVAPGMLGDGDWSKSLDIDDFDILATCMAGPEEITSSEGCVCPVMDFDDDGDVDTHDYAAWQRALTE